MSRVASLAAAYHLHKATEGRLEKAFKDSYPPGSTICWIKHGPNVQQGIVEHHCYGATLVGRNNVTGARVRLAPYHVLASVGALT